MQVARVTCRRGSPSSSIVKLVAVLFLTSCSFMAARGNKPLDNSRPAAIDTAIAAGWVAVAISAFRVGCVDDTSESGDDCKLDLSVIVGTISSGLAAMFASSAVYGATRAEQRHCGAAREQGRRIDVARAQVRCDRKRVETFAQLEHLEDSFERLRMLEAIVTCDDAKPRTRAVPSRAFVAVGFDYSAESSHVPSTLNGSSEAPIDTDALVLEGGYHHTRLPLGVHAAIEAGTTTLYRYGHDSKSSSLRVRGGLAARGCGYANCVFAGFDVGYQRRGNYEPASPHTSDDGYLLIPNVGAEIAVSDRWMLRASLDLYWFKRHALETHVDVTDENGTGVALAIGYRFGTPRTSHADDTPLPPSDDPRAWALIIDAALAAEAGNCAEVRNIDPEVAGLAPELYRTVFVRSSRIVHCLSAN